jgi:DNA-binding MarR family transcriptional regulator
MSDKIFRSDFAAQAAEVCLCLHVRRASRAITQVFDLHLTGTGLKATQINLLMAVNALRSPTVGRLADALATDSTTLTRTLKPLVRDGLVTLSPDSSDRRSKRVVLSADGLAALERAMPAWQTAQSAVASQLGSSAIQGILPVLERSAGLIPSKS